jgi:putative effector of murein hydrolase LrgA (UPF0299 family)
MSQELEENQTERRRAYLIHSLPFLWLPIAVFLPLEYFNVFEQFGLPTLSATVVYGLCPSLWLLDLIDNWKNSNRSMYKKGGPWVVAVCCCAGYLAFYAIMVTYHKI